MPPRCQSVRIRMGGAGPHYRRKAKKKILCCSDARGRASPGRWRAAARRRWGCASAGHIVGCVVVVWGAAHVRRELVSERASERASAEPEKKITPLSVWSCWVTGTTAGFGTLAQALFAAGRPPRSRPLGGRPAEPPTAVSSLAPPPGRVAHTVVMCARRDVCLLGGARLAFYGPRLLCFCMQLPPHKRWRAPTPPPHARGPRPHPHAHQA